MPLHKKFYSTLLSKLAEEFKLIEKHSFIDQNTKTVTLNPNFFYISDTNSDESFLIGSKCQECGLVSWPKRQICPSCVKIDTEKEIILGKTANLISFAIIGQQSEGFNFPIPYIQGLVQLIDGPILFSIIDGDPDLLALGQEMELYFDKIAEDKNGKSIVSYKFKAVKK